jgi:hypothetical protein
MALPHLPTEVDTAVDTEEAAVALTATLRAALAANPPGGKATSPTPLPHSRSL